MSSLWQTPAPLCTFANRRRGRRSVTGRRAHLKALLRVQISFTRLYGLCLKTPPPSGLQAVTEAGFCPRFSSMLGHEIGEVRCSPSDSTVCTLKRMLKKVGAFAKDPILDMLIQYAVFLSSMLVLELCYANTKYWIYIIFVFYSEN
ncbi:uncharacterized protein LOC131011263 [Salvia miltiorrhiza]|uniref:uncharacterized protein LOC131011263 n=1 Tax=Salvia miltiorrhiza TaxID=226208 RepID=UPI0025ABA1E0|nr:uncharacterized protein LOC131011263 [Salvia miltiorrhiza]